MSETSSNTPGKIKATTKPCLIIQALVRSEGQTIPWDKTKFDVTNFKGILKSGSLKQ